MSAAALSLVLVGTPVVNGLDVQIQDEGGLALASPSIDSFVDSGLIIRDV